jgi:hypothetical protein
LGGLSTYAGILEYVRQFSPGRHPSIEDFAGGETLIFNGYTHEEFVDLFHQIGQDAGNRVVILTGAGAAFTEAISPRASTSSARRATTRIIARAEKSR